MKNYALIAISTIVYVMAVVILSNGIIALMDKAYDKSLALVLLSFIVGLIGLSIDCSRKSYRN